MSATKQPPTAEQIAEEILALISVRQLVRPYTAFGDDNHAAIDAQREVLSERLSMDEIHDRFGSDDDDIDGEELDEGFDQHLLDCAIEAHDWMTGERALEEGRPSEGWGVLTKSTRT